MGVNSSTSKLSDINRDSKSNLISFNLPQYGGKVEIDKQRRMVYQRFQIEDEQSINLPYLIEKRKKLNHRNLITVDFVQKIESSQQQSICLLNKQCTYLVGYKLYSFSLFNQIQRICKVRQLLPQNEVRRIFKEVVECLNYLKNNNTLHGDIKVSSIFLDQNRAVKLIDSYFVKKGRTAYEIVLEDPNSMSLLSPEQLELLRLKLFDSLQNSFSNQIFSVGMCMIELTTVQEAMQCYDLHNLKIKQSFFTNMMQKIISYGYSQELSSLIISCVHKSQYRRPSYQEFLTQINRMQNYGSKR